MPNGAQAPTEEGEASGGESQEEEEWDSDVAEDDDDDDDDDGDEDDAEDETRVHPEAVDDITLERWMVAVTRNKDNPRGARRIPPLDHNSDPNKVRLLCSPLCSCHIHFCLSCRLVD